MRNDKYKPEPKTCNCQWISVTERLPTDDRNLLVTTQAKNVRVAYYSGGQDEWITNCGHTIAVISYNELPEPYLPPKTNKP